MRPFATSGVPAPDCDFDYSTPEAQAALRDAIDEILEIRQELGDPAMARRIGRLERVYEWSLGLAVIPVLIGRGLRRPLTPPSSEPVHVIPDLSLEIRQALGMGGTDQKMRLYERSLGLAVIPVLMRRLGYKVWCRARKLPA